MKARGLLLALALAVSAGALPACGGTTYIEDLPLVWSGAKSPRPSPAVAAAYAAGPIALGDLRDARARDPRHVGTYEDDGFKVMTNGDVRAFWAGRVRTMLEDGGARLGEPAQARIDAELVELDCLEGNTFNATAGMRVTVTRYGKEPWSKLVQGTSRRWGRTHKPAMFNEAISNALADAMKKLVNDPEFAAALTGAT